MFVPFQNVLAAAMPPLVLISAVGLILLSAVNRFSQATSRTRKIIAEKSQSGNPERKKNLDAQISILVRRCRILRASVAFLVASVTFSALIVLTGAFSVLAHKSLDAGLTLFLVTSCFCIIAANIVLLWDVTLSLKALVVERDYFQDEERV